MNKNILTLLAATVLALVSCEDLDFDDPSTLTNEEAVEKIKSFNYTLTTGAVQNLFFATTDEAGIHFSLLADQSTNTNGSRNWWNYAQEPRIRILNSSTERSYSASLNTFFSSFSQANLDATKVLDFLENQRAIAYDDNGDDRTEDCIIAAYYVKGVAQGYLGAIFDRGVIVDDLHSAERSFKNSYKEMIENGVKNIDKAIALAEKSTTFKFDFLKNQSLDKQTFIQIANSEAAKILAAQAREQKEAESLGSEYWQRVYNYASRGITQDVLFTYVSGGYYNEQVHYLTYEYGGHAYLQADVKLPYLADKTRKYPNSYPEDDSVLDDIESSDPRFHEYFAYDSEFGIMMSARGRWLFGNYKRTRWHNASNALNEEGAISPYLLAEELRLIKADALFFQKDYQGAAELLNDPSSARKAKGLWPDVPADAKEIADALHYEYSIEIDGAGGAFEPFGFMRRHDLLQGGTPTQYPIPQTELEVIGEEIYSFGGKQFAGERGIWNELATAEDKGWKASR